MSSTTYARRTQYKPIDFFFRGVCDAKTKKVAFVDAFQILNDRFLGRMSVCNYFFIAENSVRINELNVIALDELRNYHLVMRQNFYIPEKTVYSLPITTRFLANDKEFDILVATLKENGYKKGSLVISFNCNTIMQIDQDGKKRYDKLRRLGYKTCVNGFGEEFNALDIFARFNFDYLRLEASYFDAAPSKKKLLGMLVKFCSANKIGLVMEGVDSPAQLNRFRKEGVKLVTGKAVSKLGRWVTNEFLGLPEPSADKKKELRKTVDKIIEDEEKRELDDIKKIQDDMIRKAREAAESGKVLPSAPRPELMKSPYQVRLEKQKEAAKRAAIEREQKISEKAPRQSASVLKETEIKKRIEGDESKFLFEGEVQGLLSMTSAYDQKAHIKTAETSDGATEKKKNGKKNGRAAMIEEATAEVSVRAEETAVEQAAVVKTSATDKDYSKDENAENSNAVNSKAAAASKKKNKNIVADEKKAEKLYNEIKKGSLDDQLRESSGFGGFGVSLSYDDGDDEEVIIGHYNEKGQWVDEDGYIYNGYFDENGDWQDYVTFDSKEEGSYNEQGQWVDKDGNVYDGYFDEEGRWIDYTYVDANGQKADNGYFDNKIKKWVPFGYFDENGVWQTF